jgi:excisionase family DNA binding protein
VKQPCNIPGGCLSSAKRPTPERRLLDIKEASAYLGLQVDTIYRMVSQRRIPFIKVGRRTKFDIGLLNEWLTNNTVMPTPQKVA